MLSQTGVFTLTIVDFTILICGIIISIVMALVIIPKLTKKRTEKTVEQTLDEKKSTIDENNKLIHSVNENVTRLTQAMLEVARTTYKNAIYNMALSVMERMEATLSYIKVKGNGGVVEYACADFIFKNDDMWKTISAKDEADPGFIFDKEFYKKQLDVIRRSLT